MKTSDKIFLFFGVLCSLKAQKTLNYASYFCSYSILPKIWIEQRNELKILTNRIRLEYFNYQNLTLDIWFAVQNQSSYFRLT